MIKLICAALSLQCGISEFGNTVGVVGYRESVFGHKVLLVHPGSPLEGKVQPGDGITAVDGNKNNHNTRGEPGTPVTLTVNHNGHEFDLTVRRVPVQALQNRYLNHYFGVKD